MNRYLAELFLLLALLAGCSEKQEAGVPPRSSAPAIAGKELAQEKCSGCHGMDGRGVTDNIPNLAGQIESYLIKAAQTYDHGKRAGSSDNAMAAIRELSPEQLRNVLGYYASLPALSPSGKMDAAYSYYDRGKVLSQVCANCHGADGNPSDAGVPRLAGQHPQYIIKASLAYKDNARSMPVMHEKLAGLSRADVANIAIYFALNTPRAIDNKKVASLEGKQFISPCIKCHGPSGSGDYVGIPNLAGQDVKYLSAALKSYRGKDRSQAVMHKTLEALGDKEIEKIAIFFAAEKPAQSTFAPPEAISQLVQKCDQCHRNGSTNPEMLAPKLNGQNRTYLINAMTAYRDGDRGNSAMHKIGSVLYFDATIEGIATHYSAQIAK